MKYLNKKNNIIRICMVSYSFYESDNRVLRYAETLVNQGNEVDVIALNRGDLPQVESYKGVKVCRIQRREKNEKNPLVHLYRLAKFFLKSSVFLFLNHLKNPYHIIHVHNIPDFLVFVAFLPKLLGAKVILDIHDIVPELYSIKFNKKINSLIVRALVWIEKLSCCFADHIIIANNIWYERMVSRSSRRSKCSVIINCPDDNIFLNRSKKSVSNKFILIYPGTLTTHQGVDVAIKAFKKVTNEIPSAEFHIYGDGTERASLERLVAKLGLEKQVIFKGRKSILEISNIMAEADLGIEPKRDGLFSGEAMSTKVFEFMALGVPVVVSDTRAHNYYLSNSVVKFFKNGDSSDLANSIIMLFKDMEYRQQLIEEGRKFVNEYLWSKQKEKYLKLVNLLRREDKDQGK